MNYKYENLKANIYYLLYKLNLKNEIDICDYFEKLSLRINKLSKKEDKKAQKHLKNIIKKVFEELNEFIEMCGKRKHMAMLIYRLEKGKPLHKYNLSKFHILISMYLILIIVYYITLK
jgi:hypothetical protein